MKTDKHKRNPRLQNGALFVIKSSVGRLFWCTIRKLSGNDEEEFISGNTVVDEGLIVSNAETLDRLKSKMGEVCRLKLEYDLHKHRRVRSKILKTDFFHN